MPKTSINHPEIGPIFVTKNKGQRSMRLRVDTKGQIQVSMPWLVPKATALAFVMSKLDWIKQQQNDFKTDLYDGMLIGKTLRLKILENSNQTRSKSSASTITVHLPKTYHSKDSESTTKILKAIQKALRVEAEKILLPRLREFADMYGYEFRSSSVKQLVGRWGSCDTRSHITLSLYLIQLPIELIDYVLIHELVHTKHMNHSASFWNEVEKQCQDYKLLRRKMKTLQPRIYDAKAFMS